MTNNIFQILTFVRFWSLFPLPQHTGSQTFCFYFLREVLTQQNVYYEDTDSWFLSFQSLGLV